MDQLARAARRPRRQVAGLDQPDREAARRRVERDADTGDPAADRRGRRAAPAPAWRPPPRGRPDPALRRSRLRPHVHLERFLPAGSLPRPPVVVEARRHPASDPAADVLVEQAGRSAASVAMPRAGRLRIGGDLERQPREVGDGLQQSLVSGEPAADAQHVRRASRVDGLQRVGDLVRDASEPAAPRSAAVVVLLAPRTVIRSAPCQWGVPRPAGAGTTTGCGRDQSGPPASARSPGPEAAPARCPRSRRRPRARRSAPRPAGPRRPWPARRPAVPALGADVQPQEGAGAQRERGHARRRAALAVERRRLVSEHRGHRCVEPGRRARSMDAGIVGRPDLGQQRRGTPNRSSSPSSQRKVARSTSSERQAFEGSVTWASPPERCQASQHATSPKSSSPASARSRSTGSASKSQASFGAEKVGSSGRPVFVRDASASGHASAAHSSAARWSCQLTTGVTARPVSRSHSTKDSVWLAMPISGDRRPPARRPRRSPPAPRQAARRDRARPDPATGAGSTPDGPPTTLPKTPVVRDAARARAALIESEDHVQRHAACLSGREGAVRCCGWAEDRRPFGAERLGKQPRGACASG